MTEEDLENKCDLAIKLEDQIMYLLRKFPSDVCMISLQCCIVQSYINSVIENQEGNEPSDAIETLEATRDVFINKMTRTIRINYNAKLIDLMDRWEYYPSKRMKLLQIINPNTS